MEAPEKLYILFNKPYTVDYTKLNKRLYKEQMEYIRTDVFIKKARKYFIKELPNFRSFMESGTVFIKNFESFIQEE